MFGWLSKKDKKASSKSTSKAGAKPQSRDELKAQALANAKKARAAIGEENVQKLAEMLQQHEQAQAQQQTTNTSSIPDVSEITDPGQYKPQAGSPAEAAKKIIEEMDKGDVAHKLRQMIEDDRN